MLGLLLCQATLAQTLYRCGNSYQDKPCPPGTQGKTVTILKHADNGQTADSGKGVANAVCIQRGLDAQKLVWAREGGALEADAMARATSERERELVLLVYRTRGSASSVRQAAEAACLAEQGSGKGATASASGAATAKPAAATPAEASAAAAQPSAPSAASAPSAPSAPSATTPRASASVANKASCEQLKREMEKLLGPDVKNEQRKVVENGLKQSGC